MDTFDQLTELATTAAAENGDAADRAAAVSGHEPLCAVYVFRPVTDMRGGWSVFQTGSMLDFGLILVAGLRRVVRRLQRRSDPLQVAALYPGQIDVLTWEPESAAAPDVVEQKVGGRSIYIGAYTLRIGGASFGISLQDRDELVAAMLSSAWRPQLVQIG